MQADAIYRTQKASEARYRQQLMRERHKAGYFVLSYPKSGRTWHRVMLGHYLTKVCGRNAAEALNLDHLCSNAGIPCIIYSHNSANFIDWLEPDHPQVASPDLWRDKPVLLLLRDPRDIVVSAYHHARFRQDTFRGTLSEFIREPRVGLVKVLTALNRWHENRHLAATFSTISYEQMHRDSKEVLRRTLEKIGTTSIDEEWLAQSAKFAEFSNMRNHEASDFFGSARVRNDDADPRAAKVRTGLIGGFLQHFSTDDIAWAQSTIDRIGDPFGCVWET